MSYWRPNFAQGWWSVRVDSCLVTRASIPCWHHGSVCGGLCRVCPSLLTEGTSTEGPEVTQLPAPGPDRGFIASIPLSFVL